MFLNNNDKLHRTNWRNVCHHRICTKVGKTQPQELSKEEIKRFSEEEIKRLPCLASDYWPDDLKFFGWTPPLRELLNGVRDCNSSLSLLEGFEDTLVRYIFEYLASEFLEHVTLTIPATHVGNFYNDQMARFEGIPRRTISSYHNDEIDCTSPPIPTKSSSPSDFVAWTTCGQIRFPPPNNRNVNMMPFVYGDNSSLPEELRCYQECIDACPILSSDIGKIFYLTVHESYVNLETAQRREGLHIETPGSILDENAPAFSPGKEHEWGRGMFFEPDHYEGGIYMASNVSNTSRIYDAIVDSNSMPGIVDAHGGCEHLRSLFGHKGTNLEAGQLIWMTDRTPHEALPHQNPGYRQFFRIVTSETSHWFAKHSTPNPNVHPPGHVVIVRGDKFKNIKLTEESAKKVITVEEVDTIEARTAKLMADEIRVWKANKEAK